MAHLFLLYLAMLGIISFSSPVPADPFTIKALSFLLSYPTLGLLGGSYADILPKCP